MTARERPLRWTASVLSLALLAITLYTYFVSRHRILWSDELFAWTLLTDPSFHHMLSSWRAGADSGGIGFYLLGRVWIDLFGKSDMAFSAFSAIDCFIAFAFAWLTLRRIYRQEFVLAILFVTWFGSDTILWQMIQARFYGMLLAGVAFVLFTTVRSTDELFTHSDQRNSTLFLNFAANVLLVSAHPLGIVYSAIILCGTAMSDLLHHRRRLFLYATSVLSWTAIWFSRENMQSTANVGKPHFWTTTPHPIDLLKMYQPDAVSYILYPVLLFLLITLLWPSRRHRLFHDFLERSQVLIPGMILTAAPVALWILSQRGTSLFVDRYLIPFTLGVAILGLEALTQLFPSGLSDARLWARLGCAALLAFLLFCSAKESIQDYPKTALVPPFDFTETLAAQIPSGLPVVFERPDIFHIMLFQQPTMRSVYLLDWETAIDPASPRGMVPGFHEMATWKKVGYYSNSILDSQDFLSKADDFIVVQDQQALWFDHRILNNPDWETRKLAIYKNSIWSGTIWRVHKKSMSSVM